MREMALGPMKYIPMNANTIAKTQLNIVTDGKEWKERGGERQKQSAGSSQLCNC